MAKKIKSEGRKTSSVEANVQPASSGAAVFAFAREGRSADREFNPDYSPVVKDLRRILALAGSFFVILIVLSFFLH